MQAFRNHTPKRRNITTKVSHYREHLNELKIDYNNRCGYCGDFYTWRISWFEIDHFVPQKHLVTISPEDYSNLVFACRSCNNAKRAKWPTGSETQHNINDEGFIDPCDDEYNNQFSRFDDGRIKAETKLGEWIYRELRFYKPQHEIIWNIEQLAILIEECKSLLESTNNENIKDRLLKLYDEYFNYTKQLGDC